MKAMISNLPKDMIEEIISRVPFKSMKAVQLTCKDWNNLSKSESFKKMHIKKATRENMMIAGTNRSIYLMSVVVDNDDQSIERKGKLSFLNDQVAFHYEGLLLCFLKEYIPKIVVLNPYLGQTRWIDLRYSHLPYEHGDLHIFSYGLGYEDKESCRSVKLLRFLDYFRITPTSPFFCYEIYDFDSGLWTTLDVIPHWYINHSSHGFSLKGNTYWCATERGLENYFFDYIICFDFTTERFGPLLPLPSCASDRGFRDVTLSCVKEDKLVALFQYRGSFEFEIWITTKIEVEMVSWSKFLRIDVRHKLSVPLSFVIDEEKKVYINLNGFRFAQPHISIMKEAGYPRYLNIGEPADRSCYSYMCPYVPSLVQIKETCMRQKRQSSLEKENGMNTEKGREKSIEKGSVLEML